jgi:hypothetical protein
MAVIATLEDLVRELHRVFEADTCDRETVQQLTSTYKSNKADWEKYAYFDSNR